ncbi:hypothetical protein ABZ756_02210 [Mammaliicoccus sciuri]
MILNSEEMKLFNQLKRESEVKFGKDYKKRIEYFDQQPSNIKLFALLTITQYALRDDHSTTSITLNSGQIDLIIRGILELADLNNSYSKEHSYDFIWNHLKHFKSEIVERL